jgi:hypothetical protein
MLFHPALLQLATCQCSCLFAQWRRQQIFLRSQWFFNGRVLTGPASWQEKWHRIQQRSSWDTMAMLYDCGEMNLDLCSQALGQLDSPWSAPWQDALARSRTACLNGLLEYGRETLFRISPV